MTDFGLRSHALGERTLRGFMDFVGERRTEIVGARADEVIDFLLGAVHERCQLSASVVEMREDVQVGSQERIEVIDVG